MMVNILQCNLNRSRLAQDLVPQLAFESRTDLLIVSEQYRNMEGQAWYADQTGTAAIWVRDRMKIPVHDNGKGEGFVWIRSERVTYVSVYLSPNGGIAVFRERLEALEDFIREIDGEVVVAGDFNAKAPEWGMDRYCTRGNTVVDMVSRLDLTVLNAGCVTTFRRPGYRGTIIDITLTSSGIAARTRDWTVMEGLTGSDHQYITFTIGMEAGQTGSYSPPRGWNVNRLDRKALLDALPKTSGQVETNPDASGEEAERLIDQSMVLVSRACDVAMPKRAPNRRRKPAYWWNDEIAELRRQALALRRKAQRLRKKGDPRDAAERYVESKKRLGRAIKESKKRCWDSLCANVNEDVWGRGYQIVSRRLGCQAPEGPRGPSTMENIVATLFPDHPDRQHTDIEVEGDVPVFTVGEVQASAKTLGNRKAPGPDGIPVEVVKEIAKECPYLLLNMYNSCLRAGIFGQRWKLQRLVLLDKGKGPPITPSSFRPLCMLDNVGKLYEKLLRTRLRAAVKEAGGLSKNQHGFRVGHSTIGAIAEVVEAARKEWQGNHRTRNACVLVTLDVKNAFNTARWVDILDALEHRFGVPTYLRRVISDYLNNRELMYQTTEGPRKKRITAGVAQGSALGPDLWNILYDGILRLDLPEYATIIGFADDVAITILARNPEEARRRVEYVTRIVKDWLEARGLHLAANKTEVVVLTRRRNFLEPLRFSIDGEIIDSGRTVKYLGVTIDAKLTFWAHLQETATKASKAVTALARLMPNMNGPSPAKRRTLMGVVHSILLYGSEIWADALLADKYRRKLASIQRKGALRIASAYRTVSEAAVLVIAGIVPIDIQAMERKRVYHRHRDEGRTNNIKEQERTRSLNEWQRRWSCDSKGRWTARLLGEVAPWISRKHGEVSFHLTQFLTGHGHFNKYLHRMGRKNSPKCDYCEEDDNADHTFFQCDRWETERREMWSTLGEVCSPDNVVDVMLRSEVNWDAVAKYVGRVLRTKKKEEQERERTIQDL